MEQETNEKKSKSRTCIIIALVVILLVIGLGVVGVVACTKILKGSDETASKFTEEELDKYDGKTLNITSDDKKISGSVALTRTEKNTLRGSFRIFINDEYASNHKDANCDTADVSCKQLNTAYYYVGILQNSSKERELSSPFMKRNCIKENKDYDPFDDYSPTCLESKKETVEGIPSNNFEMGLSKTFNSVEEIFDIKYLEIHDAADAFEDSCENQAGVTSCSSSIDTKIGEGGKIVKTYNISLSE